MMTENTQALFTVIDVFDWKRSHAKDQTSISSLKLLLVSAIVHKWASTIFRYFVFLYTLLIPLESQATI